jgi:hypothetical protein
MLTDIRALADHFLIVLPNINTCHHVDWVSSVTTFHVSCPWGFEVKNGVEKRK